MQSPEYNVFIIFPVKSYFLALLLCYIGVSCMYLYMHSYIHAHMNMRNNFSVYHRSRNAVEAAAAQWWYREPWKSNLSPKAFLFSSSYVSWTRESHCCSLLTLRALPRFFSAYGNEEKYRSGNLSAQLIPCAPFSWHTGILLLSWATRDWYE